MRQFLGSLILCLALGACAHNSADQAENPPSGLPSVSVSTGQVQNNIDEVNGIAVQGGAVTLSAGAKSVTLEGWAFDSNTGLPAGGVFASAGGAATSGDYGLPRPDVAKAFKQATLAKTGYRVDIPLARLAPGTQNEIDTWILSHDGKALYRGRSVKVTVP